MGGVFSGIPPSFCYHDNSMLWNNHSFILKSVSQKNRRLIFSPSNLPGRVYLCYVILIGLNPMMPCIFSHRPPIVHLDDQRSYSVQETVRFHSAKNGRHFHYIHIRTQKSSPLTESSQFRHRSYSVQETVRFHSAKNGRHFHYIYIRTQKSSPLTESSQLRRFKKIPLIHVNKQ